MLRTSSRRKFGQIEQLKSGNYRARYTGPDGKMYSAPRTYRDIEDAMIWLKKQERLIELDAWQPPEKKDKKTGITVGKWLEDWLDLRARGIDALKPSTLQSYTDVINRRILNPTGDAGKLRRIPLKDLTRADVAFWWDAINAQFDSPTYNRNAYVRLKTAINAAVERELIDVNPVNIHAARKKPPSHRKELPTIDVMNGIIEQLDHSNPRMDGRYKIIAILTLFHGLRIGEVLALRRQDITDTGRTIIVHVRGNVYRKPGEGMVRLNTAKTAAGVRDVPIFERFHDDIRYHLKTFVGNRKDADVCVTGNGKIITDTSYRSVFNRAKKRAGYEDVRITPHYGRVWLITMLAEKGMPIPAIGELLGQVDLKTITEIYMRATSTKKDQVLKRLGREIEEDSI